MRAILIGVLALLLGAGSMAQDTAKTVVMTKNVLDTIGYEILIIDIHFDQWYLINYDPTKDRTNEYYRFKNLTAVINWNDLYRTRRYNRVIDCYIDYLPTTDYGIGVNRKLYWYFTYVEEKYRIRLF